MPDCAAIHDWMPLYAARRPSYAASGVWGMLAALAITIAFVAYSRDCVHWFIIPVTLCGALVAIDGIHWLRGGYDPFDVYGLFGLYGILFFQVNPLLHVAWDMFAELPNSPDDWRYWLGVMGGLNAIGLLLLHLARRLWPRGLLRAPRTTWQVSRKKLLVWTPIFLGIAAVFQVYAFAKAGGVGGMTERGAMAGMGAVLMIGESFPVLLLLAITLRRRFLDYAHVSRKTLFVFVGLMVLLMFLFTGLRGSRSNFVQGLIVLGAVIHIAWRPISTKVVLGLLPPLFVFLVVYGLYKDIRGDLLDIRSLSEYHERTEHRRNWKLTLLGDLGKSDIQAIVCAHACSAKAKPRYGTTYAHAFSLLIPRRFRPTVDSKAVAGTYVLYDYEITADSKHVGQLEGQSSRIYGWAGEAMLNFGVLAAPLTFLAFGLWQITIRAIRDVMPVPDVRVLLYPVLLQFGLHVGGDIDNLVFGVVKSAAFPLLFLFFVRRRGLPEEEIRCETQNVASLTVRAHYDAP